MNELRHRLAACILSLAVFAALPGGAWGAVTSWSVDSDGDWGDAGSWDNGVPGNGDDAVLGSVITAPREVSLSGNQGFKTIALNSTQSYTIVTGGHDLTHYGGGATDISSVTGGDHVINGKLRTTANGGFRLEVAAGSSLTVLGDFEATRNSGRGIRSLSGGGSFVVTGQAYTSGWFGASVNDSSLLALEGGLLYRNSYNAQNNKTLTINDGSTFRAGGTLGSDTDVFGSPNLVIKGTLDPFGDLTQTDGNLDLSGADALDFTLGATSDRILFSSRGAGSDGTDSPTLTGPSSPIPLNIEAGMGLTAGFYDLIDWSGATSPTVTGLELSDFLLDMPDGWEGVLQFDGTSTRLQLSLTSTAQPIPEPSTLVLAALGFLGLGLRVGRGKQ